MESVSVPVLSSTAATLAPAEHTVLIGDNNNSSSTSIKAETSTDDDDSFAEPEGENPPKDLQFWLIMGGLLTATFLSALDLTAISTALPTIAAALDSKDFSWIGNAYSISSAAVIPWSGGLAHVFGRRPVLLGGLFFFAAGSALCGAAKQMNLMLAGRTFQGIGSGVILSLVEIVLADLVSLAERGAYQGAFGAVWALASAIGPVVGGAWADFYWQGLFWMNLPLTVIVIVVVFFFMNLKAPPGTIKEKLKKMDWLGNAIFIPSITLFIMGLVWGGAPYAWTSPNVLAPMVIGGVGLIAWYVVEKWVVAHPTVPFRIFRNRTTIVGFFTTFIHGISSLCAFYFWPVYFQSVKGASAVKSSVDFFSVAFVVAPMAIVAGVSVTVMKIYKPQNIIGWVFMIIGPGLLMLVKVHSPVAAWALLPIPYSIGVGLLYAATSFPILSPLKPSQAGHALAFLVFLRSFGNIFGITIGTIVFQNELAKKLPASYIAMLPEGAASAYAAIPTVKDLPEPLRTVVRTAFADTLRAIWLVMIPFGAIGLLASVWMKQLDLNTETDSNFGVAAKKTGEGEQEKA